MATDQKEERILAHEIIIARSKQEIQQCFDVRVKVFHTEQKFPIGVEFDDKDDFATHFLLRLLPSLEPVGTIRGFLVPGTTDTYKLTRLAVLKEYRKYGFGRELVEALHTWVKQHASSATTTPPVTVEALEAPTDTIITQLIPSSESVVVSETATLLKQKDIKILCSSQIYAIGFYTKFGYVPEGEKYLEDGDPHQKMVFKLRLSKMVYRFSIPQ